MDCPWYSPVCDELLIIFRYLFDNYDKGKVYASRSYLDNSGNYVEAVDKATIYHHKITLRQNHADHLLRILQTLIPKKRVTVELKEMPSKLKYLPVNHKVKGHYVDLMLYKGYIKDIVDTLESAKSGTYRLSQISDIISEDKEKAPFEF